MGGYWLLLVHGGYNSLSVCVVHILQGREVLRPFCFRNHGWAFAWQDMDPGRYGLHQGWDNNSVIVVSSLNKFTYNGDDYSKKLLGFQMIFYRGNVILRE